MNNFPRYDNYKDSGVDWLGDIPKHWKVMKLKNTAISVLGKMLCNESKGNYFLKSYLKSKNIQWLKVDVSSVDEMWFSEKELKDYKLKRGDLVVSEGGEVGKTCIWNNELEECYIQNSAHKITFNNESNSRFYLYLFFTIGDQGFFEAIVNRVSIGHLTKDKLINIELLQPPLSEQTAIAEFLDRKTAQIEQAIAQKERLIELLKERRQILIHKAVTRGLNPNVKLKHSGVDWIGEIPEHWEIRRLKFLGEIRYGLGQPPKEKENGLPLIRATNVERGEIVETGLIFVDPDDIPWERNPELKENDIIVVRSGAYTADSAIIPKYYAGAIAGYDMVITPKQINPRFLSFALLAKYVLFDQLYLLRMRAAQPHLNVEELGNTLILLPPEAEQVEISQYIGNVSAKIFTLVECKRKEIEKLKEYKAVLINSAVTGKIKVESKS